MATSTMWSTYRCWAAGWGTEFDGLEPLVLVSRNQIEIGSDFWNRFSKWKLLTTGIGDKFSTQFICGTRSWTRSKSLEKNWKTWVEWQAKQVNKGSKWNLSVFSFSSLQWSLSREQGRRSPPRMYLKVVPLMDKYYSGEFESCWELKVQQ